MATNGYLSKIAKKTSTTLDRLKVLADQKAGGWDAAMTVAAARRAELDLHTGSESDSSVRAGDHLTVPKTGQPASGASSPGSDAPPTPLDGTTQSYIDANTAAVLRQRLVGASENGNTTSANVKHKHIGRSPATSPPVSRVHSEDPSELAKPSAPGIHPLADHPDEAVSTLAKDLSELESELVSQGPKYVRWPANIGWKDFSVYMLIPTLVYELEYPRTDR